MYVNDLEAARRFFTEYLDGHSNDGYHNRTTDKPDLADPDKPLNRTGYAHIAFSVGSREKVDALTERLRSDGFEVVSGPRTTGDGYYESCIVVIERNQIEITV